MSAPRTKRQFAGAASDPAQRQITSFFPTTANSASPSTTTSTSTTTHNNNNTSSTSSSRPNSYNSANLPASVQANLLSVGMRVRKSVPEGYKTGTYSAFALWDEHDADPTMKAGGMNMGMGMGITMGMNINTDQAQRSRANAFSSPRELLPFCGIHKVGGMDTQPASPVHADMPPTPTIRISAPSPTPPCQPIFSFGAATSTNDIYAGMPGLTTSQESVDSNASSVVSAPTRKRYFVEDEDDEKPRQLEFWRPSTHEISVSPRSLVPVDWDNNGRAIAVPRTRRARGGKTPGSPVGGGQENVMIVDSDFEEAEFLDRGVWEVDMSDA